MSSTQDIVNSYYKKAGNTQLVPSTGKPKVDAIISSYNRGPISPTPTKVLAKTAVKTQPTKIVAPKKTAPIVKQTKFQEVVKKIGDVVMKLVQPKAQLSIAPDKQEKLISQVKPISIKPGQKKIAPKQLTQLGTPEQQPELKQTLKVVAGQMKVVNGIQNLFNLTSKYIPETKKEIKNFMTDPLTLNQLKDPKKAGMKILDDTWNAISTPIIEQLKLEAEHLQNPPETLAGKANYQLSRVGGAVNIILSDIIPITTIFTIAGDLPVIGNATKMLFSPFTLLRETTPKLSNKIVDALPIDKKSKETIKPGVAQILTLASQLYLGKAIGGKKLKELEGKFGKEDAKTIVKQAEELATERKQLPAPQQRVALPAQKEQKLLPSEVTKPEVVQGEGFTMTEKADKAKINVSKKIADYEYARDRFNQNPTLATRQRFEKAKVVMDTLKKNGYVEESQLKAKVSQHFQDGEATPQQVIGTVIKNGLEKTPEGKEAIKTAIEAQKQGLSIEVSKVVEKPKEVAQEAPKKASEEPIKVETPKTPSKIGLSVERKAIEDKLTRGFEGVAGYDKITIKEQARLASETAKDIELTRKIIRGEEPLPKGLRGTALITAMEEHIKKTGDADLAYELANSPLVSETSAAAQEMRLAAERQPDSLAVKLREIRKAKEEAFKKKYKEKSAKEIRDKIVKKELDNIKRPDKYDINRLINLIETC